MTTRKLKKRLRERYGRVPDPHYFAGDMEYIRSYYDYRRENGLDDFLIDDITWHDLDMDRLFKRVNPSRCTSGEQYLYYMLRSPAVEEGTFAGRRDLIRFAAAAGEERRLKIELILARLGCTRRADLAEAFHPASHGVGLLLFYLALLLILAAAIVRTALSPAAGVPLLLASLLLNALVHESCRRRSQRDYDTVNYSVSMILAMQRLRRLRVAELDKHLAPAYESLDTLRSVLRTGGVSAVTDRGGLEDVLVTFTLLDLIAYEFLKRKLGKCHREIFTIHEHLGRLDAAIAVASYRASLPAYAEPTLDFRPSAQRRVEALGMTHPLLKDAVPNDLVTDRPLLITGSNASGKSTYLKTAALTAVMAQSLCTCTASSYRACAFRIYSSMALSDDLLAGESYYIVEIRSLKRILDRAPEGLPIFCVVDEVLRGTNTVERIAASSQVLEALAGDGVLCMAATHDIELCELLGEHYRLFHFEEQLGEDEMLFDYKLREGAATSRNAIDLLRLMGFDESLVDRAHERADAYLQSGVWR